MVRHEKKTMLDPCVSPKQSSSPWCDPVE